MTENLTAPAPPSPAREGRAGREPARAPAPAGAARRRRSRALRPWLLLAPALLVIATLLLYPLVQVVLLSFQNKRLGDVVRGTTPWSGFANYQELFGNETLWKTVLPNTVVFAVVNVLLTVVVGTLVALLLFRLGTVWRSIVTTSILMAWAVPAVTGTYVWVFIFDPNNGIAVRLAGALHLVDPATTNWFTERVPFLSIATLNVVHHGFPFVALTVLAGLMTIPSDLIESALIDGASAWQRFWQITVPMLRPVFAVVTILSTIWDFKVFAQLYLMPGGDGANRDVLNLGVWSYLQSFAQNRFGYGSAIAVVLTLLLLLITVSYLRVLFKEEEL